MKILRNYIVNFSWFYAIVWWPITFAFYLFYRKIIVQGKENIPKSSPVIFTPNHQNAAIDPYVLVATASAGQILFLSRADIFAKPMLAKILQLIKILPIFRERDGADSLQKNDEIFNIVIEVLERKKAFCTFPEAKHNNKRFLLPLKKGIPRIAFSAEEKNDFKLGLQIVPVGIYYDQYANSGGILHVIYGSPIKVSDYASIYQENQPKALLALRNDIASSIKPLMIDIQNQEYYELYEELRYIYNFEMRQKLNLKKKQSDRFIADKKIIEVLDKNYPEKKDVFCELKKLTDEYCKIRNKAGILEISADGSKSKFEIFGNTLLMAILAPVYLYAWIVNFIPWLPSYFLIKKFKDPQFHSSVKFVLGLILFPFFYGALMLTTGLVFKSWMLQLMIFLSFFPAIIIFVNGKNWYREVFSDLKFLFQKKSKLALCLKLRNDIIKIMDDFSASV